MYLARLKIQNFRILKNVDLPLRKGLNVLLGENDSGKTAMIDAIRLLLGTRDFERIQVVSEDFYIDQNGRTDRLSIEAVFEGLSDDEAALYLEWLGVKGSRPDGSLDYFLTIRLEANRKDINRVINKYDREVSFSLTAGPDATGTPMSPEVRDLLRATYLKPLRDAEQELAARKGSRLSQILLAHPEIKQQDANDPNSIPGIIHNANVQVKGHPVLAQQVSSLNQDYLANFTLGETSIQASVDISDPTLRGILERLELTLTDNIPNIETRHGLGLNNLLFMATELLLLHSTNSPALPLVVIEEPEAHLHPQYQIRLMHFLEQQTAQNQTRQVQVIMTSHSPNLASKALLQNVVLLRSGKVYPLGVEHTQLQASDYKFLQRFLDVTKANLFFARGILIVEGDAEYILLPTIARLIGRSLEQYGVSIVNVGHVGLFRYARIFQRRDSSLMDIKVACVSDLDIPPVEAKAYLHRDRNNNIRKTQAEMTPPEINDHTSRKDQRASGGTVKTFISPNWTLEYDLCMANPTTATLVHQAIRLSETSESDPNGLTEQQENDINTAAQHEVAGWMADGLSQAQICANIYESLYSKKASKVETAQYLSKLLEESLDPNNEPQNRQLFPQYLRDAIDYVTSNNL
jgi:putative ATP-dependent endonuclease of OLD family